MRPPITRYFLYLYDLLKLYKQKFDDDNVRDKCILQYVGTRYFHFFIPKVIELKGAATGYLILILLLASIKR